MKMISTPDGPTPAGHYSQAVVHGGVVYVAGMLGRDPSDPSLDPGGAAEQTRTALANVRTVLEAYAEVMGDHRPARAIVPVKAFSDPFVVEIVATAAVGD